MHFILGYNFQYINRYNIIIAVEKLQYLQTVNNQSFFGWLGFPHTNHSTIRYRIVSYLINVTTTLSLQSKLEKRNMFECLFDLKIATVFRIPISEINFRIFTYLKPVYYYVFFFLCWKLAFHVRVISIE